MKILVVEDENLVVNFLKNGLTEAGHEVSVALDGQTGLEMALKNQYDLALMDIMLPKKNGIDVVRELRHHKIDVHIIMLTALGTTENVITGLDNGADDYLVKPFKFDELLARINAVSRRGKSSPATQEDEKLYLFDNIEINDHSKTVKRAGKKVNLTATEYKLLLYLMRNKERVVTREQILNSVWDINFDLSTNVVDVYVNYLRKKLEHTKFKPVIHTVVGMGYVLKLDD